LPARHAIAAAERLGDLTYAAISRNNLLTELIATGQPLADVQREAEAGLDFSRQARFGLVADLITVQLQFIRSQRGLTTQFGRFDDDQFDEERFERRLQAVSRPSIAAWLYWTRKLQALVLAGDHAGALAAAGEAGRFLWMSPFIFERADYHFFLALALVARCSVAPVAEQARHRRSLRLHRHQLLAWAGHCPQNFAGRAAVVGAEIARLRGRELEAERLFEQAIGSARDHALVHDEAIACELAARFYGARGMERVARVYLEDARACYRRWGADAKVQWLDASFPHLREERPDGGRTATIDAPVEHLDLSTVIKVSQAIAGEIVLEKLVETLLRTALEQAGAERGVLVMSRGAELWVTAEATTAGDAVAVRLREEPAAAADLPHAVLQYVARTRESVILDDAAAPGPLADDPYIRQHRARSILGLPLVRQGQLTGILYLENNLAPRVFSPTRLPVLKLLASQAAVALENTRLYQDLAEREAKIRRLIDANIIGILLWDEDGRIIEANETFLRIVGYDPADLSSGHIRWTDLTQGVDVDRKAAIQRPIEMEFSRRDGGRVPVLVGSVGLADGAGQGVAFVLDLTELKQAEAALRTVQGELAHANRIAAMGQLTASIAHEVNQPIAASVINAHAAVRALAASPPNLQVARQALDSIIKAGTRAGDVIHGIRALVKKAPLAKARVRINEAVLEVIDLTRDEAMKFAVSLRTRLAADLPPVQGDRVQLQQVILNLVLNAMEAMGEAGVEARELVVSTAKTDTGGILVAVRDLGPGLDAVAVDRLFDAFFTTKPAGMGMGLSICRSIVEAHGGRLWAEPNSPRGAVFSFEIPACEEDPQALGT
jgi:PAS domain S-box-containing protein